MNWWDIDLGDLVQAASFLALLVFQWTRLNTRIAAQEVRHEELVKRVDRHEDRIHTELQAIRDDIKTLSRDIKRGLDDKVDRRNGARSG